MRRTAYVVRRAQLTEALARAQNVCTVRHCRSRTARKTSYSERDDLRSGVLCRELSIFPRACPVVWCIHRRRSRLPAYSRRSEQKRNAILGVFQGDPHMTFFRSLSRVRAHALSRALLCGALLASAAVAAAPVDDKRIKAAGKDDADWLTHGRTYDEQRFSPLDADQSGQRRRT